MRDALLPEIYLKHHQREYRKIMFITPAVDHAAIQNANIVYDTDNEFILLGITTTWKFRILQADNI